MDITTFRKLTLEGDLSRNAHLSHFPSVHSVNGLAYDNEGYSLDIYFPYGNEEKLPLIFLVHGGGWVYGSKEINRYYAEALANEGFAVAVIDYALAPESSFPTPIRNIDEALIYLKRNELKFPYDSSKLIGLADSAGVNILSTYYSLKEKSDSLGLSFPLPFSLFVLNCGAYFSMESFPNEMINLVYEAYLGKCKGNEKHFLHEDDDLSFFPPIIELTGNGDFLRQSSLAFLNKMKKNSHRIKFLDFGDEKDEAAHDFQLDYSTPLGKKALLEESRCIKEFFNSKGSI